MNNSDKYKKYYGIILFIVMLLLGIFLSYQIIYPKYNEKVSLEAQLTEKEATLEEKKNAQMTVLAKIKKLQDAITNSQKKIYAPVESDLGNDTLFFTLYNDVIEMIHSNSIKIKSLDYFYNPEQDAFVESGKDAYFVCDVEMELVSNYVNLGKLIQDLYQYPYYIKIINVNVEPYQKDKKILLTGLKLRLYAHTAPIVEPAYGEAPISAEE